MKRIIVLLMVLGLWAGTRAQDSAPLTDSAFAALLTCGAGDEFYTAFGHTAIRVCDSAQGVDVVYNYGTFDFDTPHFYWQFTRGNLNYMLSRASFNRFMTEYAYEGRAVWQQKLNLTSQEVNNLYVMLETNYLPQYRYYRYDIIADNCATRVRDVIRAALVHRDTAGASRDVAPLTYRRHLANAMRGNLEWWRLGTDVLLGATTDRRCSAAQSMFLPVNLMLQAEAMTVGNGQPLTEETETLLEATLAPPARSFPPQVVFGALFVVAMVLTAMQIKRDWNLDVVDRVLFVLAGVVGLFLVFMWAFTAHTCTQLNYNILWASPLLILIALRMRRSPMWAVWLQVAMIIAAIVLTLVNGLSAALVWLQLTLLVRVLSLRLRRSNEQ
ncbi:MAG: DUF4105 domain-containing protein [Bacteroidales bacterium]|nr:DUF4105 domain-containing protein [Bacteroidales bacterium]MBR1850692.1 DUF4105 domain-containing protein [Bacteroidales bacterium]